MRALYSVLAATILVTPAFAGAIVVPNADAFTEAPSSISGPFQTGAITFQWQLAGSQFGAISVGTQLTGLGLRLESGQTTGPSVTQTYTSYEILLSTATNAEGSLSSIFANNEGADVTAVYNTSLVLNPNALVGGAGPNPFFVINFTTSYTYQGGDLVVTLIHNASDGSVGFSNDGLARGDGIGDTVLIDTFNSTTGIAGTFNYPVTEFITAAVPEPATFGLVGLSLLGGFLYRRRAR